MDLLILFLQRLLGMLPSGSVLLRPRLARQFAPAYIRRASRPCQHTGSPSVDRMMFLLHGSRRVSYSSQSLRLFDRSTGSPPGD